MKKFLVILGVGIVGRVCGWWDPNWAYRNEIQLDSCVNNLQNFQILVKLDTSNFDYSLANPDGSDVRFIWWDDSTKLHYYIEPERLPLFPNSDFEQGNFTNWTTSGGFIIDNGGCAGAFYLHPSSTYALGTVKSCNFIIDRPEIEFFYNKAGIHQGNGIYLKRTSDDSIIAQEEHTCSGWIRRVWDVSPHIGDSAYIEIVDTYGGSTGDDNSADVVCVDGFYKIDYTWDTLGATTIWVKIPIVYANQPPVTIYMYYGNSSATSESNLDAVYNSSHFENSLTTDLGTWVVTEGSFTHTTSYYQCGGYSLQQYQLDNTHNQWHKERIEISGLILSRVRIYCIGETNSDQLSSWWHWGKVSFSISDGTNSMWVGCVESIPNNEHHTISNVHSTCDDSVIGADGNWWYYYDRIIPEHWDRCAQSMSIELFTDSDGGDGGVNVETWGRWDVIKWFTPMCCEAPLSISETEEIRGGELILSSINPVVGGVVVKYRVPGKSVRKVRLAIYSLSGRLIKRILENEVTPGWHTVYWDGKDDNSKKVNSGVYFFRMSNGDIHRVLKITVLQ